MEAILITSCFSWIYQEIRKIILFKVPETYKVLLQSEIDRVATVSEFLQKNIVHSLSTLIVYSKMHTGNLLCIIFRHDRTLGKLP